MGFLQLVWAIDPTDENGGIINRSRIFILLFFIAVISLRIILETAFLSDRLSFYLFLHHFAWFVSVFILVALTARYLIGVPLKKLHYILYASPIILLPMMHAWIVGGYIFLYLFMGVQWFGVAPNTKAVFAIHTTLSNHQPLVAILFPHFTAF